MTWLDLVAPQLLARIFLVGLFPFSGLDKIINWDQALKQAKSSFLPGGAILLVLGIVIEFATPVMIATGWHDRLGAFVLAGFCIVTALLYHRFWAYGDLWTKGESKGRAHLWDFLKNFCVAGGLMLLIIGQQWAPASAIVKDPLSSAPMRATPAPQATLSVPETTGKAMAETKPKAAYWHAWTDEDGISRQSKGYFENFRKQSMGGAAPQWNDALGASKANVIVSVQPVGWVGEWHENPKPQWIIPLSGRWYVETMDGTRVEMGPGEMSFGEDQNCRERDGKKGHKSGTVGDEPAVLMIVQLDETPTINRPGRWK